MMVLGHEKGTDTEGRVRHNFGMANPEGYRKAVRLMHMAERFRLPVITLVDTPGAYPGARRRGAGPGGGDRAHDRGVPAARRAGGRRDHRRGRLRRRRGAGGRRSRPDAGVRGLFGDLARGLRRDPVAQRRAGAGGGRGDAPDRAGPAPARRGRRDHPGADRRRAPPACRGHRGGGRRARGRARAPARASTAPSFATGAARSSWPWATTAPCSEAPQACGTAMRRWLSQPESDRSAAPASCAGRFAARSASPGQGRS